MDTLTYTSNIGNAVEIDLIFDGAKRGTFLLYPAISLTQRALTIQSVVDAVVNNGNYLAYNYYFALAYNLILAYTDIAFPSVELKDIDGESDEERALRQEGANLTNIFEFIQRTNVMSEIAANVYGYESIIAEINDGIKFAKQKLLTDTAWNRVGYQIQDLLNNIGNIAQDSTFLENIAGLFGALDETGDTNN